ncbi:MAG TPA: hypothetical protein VIK52_00705 [Opitutaceae bacterium]
MSLARSQVQALQLAAELLKPGEVSRYFELKAALARPSAHDREQFERVFSHHYRLNMAGLTDRFRQEYFDALFTADPSSESWPDFRGLLEKFQAIPNRKGMASLQCSFVSKLVASRDESWPLYDRHVGNFFGLFVPNVGSVPYRAEILIGQLEFIRQKYLGWSALDLAHALATLRTRIPALVECHDVRVVDFLVWTAGNEKLTNNVA